MYRRPDHLAQLIRIEGACERFEAACQRGGAPDVQRYLDEADAADRPPLLEELLLLEWSYRQDRTRPPDPAAARWLFPPHRDSVESAWGRWQVYSTAGEVTVPPLPSTAPPEWEPHAGPAPMPTLPGYVSVGLLGEGGMGVVWRAHDPRLKRDVAIKFVHGHVLSPQRLAWFRKEAEALGRLKHPAIVQVYTWEEHAGVPYLVMEHVPGGTLEEQLKKGPLPVAEAVRLVVTLARAVAFAHAAGVVHRDLKPNNVLLDAPVPGENGVVSGKVVKISDFGLARLARTEEPAAEGEGAGGAAGGGSSVSTLRRTKPGAMLGTPGYMSPEQAGGDPTTVGPATDVWALGVILYRSLTGRLPFQGATIEELTEMMRSGAYTPIRQARREIPAELEAVCRRCLKADPVQRPGALELAEELQRIGARRQKWRWLLARPAVGTLLVMTLLMAVGVFAALHLATMPGREFAEKADPEALADRDARAMADAAERDKAKVALPFALKNLQRPEPPAPPRRVRILDVRLRHYETVQGEPVERGLIGQHAREVRAGDGVRVEVYLDEPAYSYLLSFDVLGEAKLLWPADETAVPERVMKIEAPATPLPLHGVVEKLACHAFVVVASPTPLPAYAEWDVANKTRGVWDLRAAPVACVYRTNGRELYQLHAGRLAAIASGQERKAAPPLEALCQLLRPSGGGSVEGVAFPVRARPEDVALLEIKADGTASEAIKGAASEARSLQEQGQYAAAEVIWLAALKRREQEVGQHHGDVAELLTELGDLYRAMGRAEKAVTCFGRALSIRRAALGSDAPKSAACYTKLAGAYRDLEKSAEALKASEAALAINRRALGESHPETAGSYVNLGFLLSELGRYRQAEAHLTTALAIRRKALGENHPETAQSYNNLAVVLHLQGKFDQAEPLFVKSLAIREAAFGKNHPDTATTLNNLGQLYKDSAEFAKAEACYRRSLDMLERTSGADHPLVVQLLTNLGTVYLEQGQPAKAEAMFLRALAIREKRLGADHPVTAQSLNSLAALYQAQGQAAKAGALFDRARRISWRQAAALPAQSIGDQVAFVNVRDRNDLDRALSSQLRPDSPAAARSAAWLVNGKAIGQEVLVGHTLARRAEADPALAEVAGRLRQVRAGMARVALAPQEAGGAQDRDRQIAELKEQEGQLSRRLAGATPDAWLDLADVRKALPAGAVLIDVARVRRYDFSAPAGKRRPDDRYAAWADPQTGQLHTVDLGLSAPADKAAVDDRWREERYAAWVTPPTGDVRVIDLGPAAAIDRAVLEVRQALDRSAKAIRAVGEAKAERQLREPLQALSRLVLAPLLPHVRQAGRWLVSPDGNLWLVPWEILLLSDETFAVERHTISYLLSARDLLAPRDKAKPGQPLVLADPDFDLGVKAGATFPVSLRQVRRLPGTLAEARAIERPLAAYAKAAPRLLLGAAAREEAVKAAKGPRVLVLATTAFFLPQKPPPAEAAAAKSRAGLEDPLLRCGLMLAGCNNPAERPGDDGVLTGLEVLGLDLRGTELVVLSACETGPGDVETGAGVACLRQAFRLAGAEAVVGTLWQVPDRSSSALMTTFFQGLAKGKDRAGALREAQLKLIEQRREERDAAHPFFWAAFTLTGR